MRFLPHFHKHRHALVNNDFYSLEHRHTHNHDNEVMAGHHSDFSPKNHHAGRGIIRGQFKRGQAAVEYALLIALLGAAVIAACSALVPIMATDFGGIVTALKSDRACTTTTYLMQKWQVCTDVNGTTTTLVLP